MIECQPLRILSRRFPRPLLHATIPWVGLVAVLALLGGCGGGTEEEELGLQTFELTVTDSGIEPNQVRLQTPQTARVVVRNESSETCDFSFGPYVQRFIVRSGHTLSMEFTAFETPVNLAAQGSLTMGCGDGVREGTIELLPGSSEEGSSSRSRSGR